VKPRTYRAPYWDFSENTLGLLERYGFEIDSSLLANDFHPYWIRPVEVHAERGDVFGPPGRILEIPGQWYLTDFSQVEFIPGFQEVRRMTCSTDGKQSSTMRSLTRKAPATPSSCIHSRSDGHT
jgi:peptidoglycan-N-acetylglucosamine deacetylase